MSPVQELHEENLEKAAKAAAFRKLLVETNSLPHAEWSAVHHVLHALGACNGNTPQAFIAELARDIRSDAWLAQSGPQDDGDEDVSRRRFVAWKRAELLVTLTDLFASEAELSR